MAELEASGNCHTPPAKKAHADDALPQKSSTVKRLKDVLRTRGGRLCGKPDLDVREVRCLFHRSARDCLSEIVEICCRFLMKHPKLRERRLLLGGARA